MTTKQMTELDQSIAQAVRASGLDARHTASVLVKHIAQAIRADGGDVLDVAERLDHAATKYRHPSLRHFDD